MLKLDQTVENMINELGLKYNKICESLKKQTVAINSYLEKVKVTVYLSKRKKEIRKM